ncbi:MAG TPA: serine/threonine-protein kinase [Pyrinomonadaceae bacterium]|jgi:serine/threonine protein kinase|nr:serine/threonine-protein kinase [Pyrinomonadaceae bacterium]
MFRENSQIGPYTLIRKLGRGGFGEVWLAERRAKFVTTKVAVKLPLQEQVDPEAIKQEATLWEQASGHPNVLPIIDADEYDGQIVIVSEYAPDGSLEQQLKENGPMNIAQALYTTVDILSGLDFLHSRRIIHRDLKPANILLQGETPRLSDFGISRALRIGVSSDSKNVSGTFTYMAPEAFDGKRSVQTDIWSVGVNLYRFLTGKFPYPQKEPTALVAAIMMHEPEPLPTDVPREIRQIIAKAMAKKPEDRYSSAGEMRDELRKIAIEKFDRRSRSRGPAAAAVADDDASQETVLRGANVSRDEAGQNSGGSRLLTVVGGILLLFLAVLAVLYFSSNSQKTDANVPPLQSPSPSEGQLVNSSNIADNAPTVFTTGQSINSNSARPANNSVKPVVNEPVNRSVNVAPAANVQPETSPEPTPANSFIEMNGPDVHQRPSNTRKNAINVPFTANRRGNADKP